MSDKKRSMGPVNNCFSEPPESSIDLNPLNVLQHANWTAVVTEIRSPANRGYLVMMGMFASLIIAIFGYRSIRVCKNRLLPRSREPPDVRCG